MVEGLTACAQRRKEAEEQSPKGKHFLKKQKRKAKRQLYETEMRMQYQLAKNALGSNTVTSTFSSLGFLGSSRITIPQIDPWNTMCYRLVDA